MVVWFLLRGRSVTLRQAHHADAKLLSQHSCLRGWILHHISVRTSIVVATITLPIIPTSSYSGCLWLSLFVVVQSYGD